VDGLDVRELLDSLPRAPGREPLGRLEVGAAGVVVADLGGEELDHPPLGLGNRSEECGWPIAKDQIVSHAWFPAHLSIMCVITTFCLHLAYSEQTAKVVGVEPLVSSQRG